jgi:hypothetical protein
MTELTDPDDSTAQPAPEWPRAASQDIGQGIADPQVARIVARLLDIPGLPTAEHEAVYNELHDELLSALNSDPVNSDRGNSNPIDQIRAATNRAGGAS